MKNPKRFFFKSKAHYSYVLGFSLFITLNLRDKNLSDEPKFLGSNSVFKRKGFKKTDKKFGIGVFGSIVWEALCGNCRNLCVNNL